MINMHVGRYKGNAADILYEERPAARKKGTYFFMLKLLLYADLGGIGPYVDKQMLCPYPVGQINKFECHKGVNLISFACMTFIISAKSPFRS
jgi:hypothetical protein